MSAVRIAARGARRRALGSTPGRAARFAQRRRGEAPCRLDTLATVPFARLYPDADLHRVALAAGLLHYRRQIDGELSGTRLAPLVAVCGEALFDRVCAVLPPPPEQQARGEQVPTPAQLVRAGRALIERTGSPVAERALALVLAEGR